MAVKIRLMRMGKKKQPFYRVVAADSRSPRDGRFIEILGTYAPREEPARVTLDHDRVKHWLSEGAKPTETVARLLKKAEEQPAEPGRKTPANAADKQAEPAGAASK